MGEFIGLAASAVTLAGLFSNCIECFSYFKAAQNCPSEAESLLVKLDCEKARLLIWADTVGILQTEPGQRYPQLADAGQDKLIRRCVEQIIGLMTDAQKLQDEYGGRTTNEEESQRYLAVLSVNSMNKFQSLKRTFFARVRTRDAVPGMLSRVKWAIRDAAKFRLLISNLRDFVDRLIQLVPVPPERINSRVEEDIVTTIDIASLRLIEDGCDGSSYQRWSARASEVIRDSEAGTLDRRSLVELLADTEAIQGDSSTSVRSQASFPASDLSTTYTHKTSFTSSSSAWGLGRRLYAYLNRPSDLDDRLERQQKFTIEYAKFNDEMLPAAKLAKLIVYCGACACAINTALQLCTDDSIPEYIEVVIRIDDRLPTSCQDPRNVADMLESIRERIEHDEMRHSSASNLSFTAVDCPALERRTFALEQQDPEPIEPEAVLQRFVEQQQHSHAQENLTLAGVIIIAETDMCSESLKHPPIRNQPRRPRAGEMYKFVNRIGDDGRRYDMDFIGRFNRSKAWMDAISARENPTQ